MKNYPIEEIRAAANIILVVSDYIELRRSGPNGWSAKCPFHEDRTPSFHVRVKEQTFRCFGCSVSGDAFSFLQRIENISFPEAARRLAERFGVDIGEKQGEGRGETGEKQGKPVPAATARRIRSHAEQTSMECAWWVRRVTERLLARRDWVCGLACMADGEMGLDRRARVWRRIIERWESMTDGDRFRMYERRRARVLRDYRDDVAWTELLVTELMNGRLKDIPGDDMFRYIGNGGVIRR